MKDQHPLPTSAISRKIEHITLEGPYGTNLHLETYETVILLAESVGIAGVLPYALDLVQRRQHDEFLKERNIPTYYRDVTRKVDLMWKLGSENEDSWCDEELGKLMALDESKVGTCTLLKRVGLPYRSLYPGGCFIPPIDMFYRYPRSQPNSGRAVLVAMIRKSTST